MAGSISLSLSQQFDELGEPLNGGLLYFFAAGTTTPQSAYQDVALTLPYPNPIELDSAGRVPAFYLADGQIKIRLANAAGVTQVAADNLLVIGASSGSGSPPTVDATTVLATGDVKARYGTGTLTGFVRLNGRTVGSATSGATERANADCEDLFLHLYAADTNLSVSGGRGASAAADWAANKNIALPDFRHRVPAGLGDMGSSNVGLFTAGYYSGGVTTLGASSGAQATTIETVNLPPYTPTGSVSVTSTTNTLRTSAGSGVAFESVGGTDNAVAGQAGFTDVGALTSTGTLTIAPQGGSSEPLRTIQPTILLTYYIKL
jgi:microcystin-dependent protein